LSGSGSDTPPEVLGKAERAAQRNAFARRLNEEMERRKWTLATLLREAGPHLPEGFKLSHSHLWHYLRGKALPHQEIRRALSLALGTDLDQPQAAQDKSALPTPTPTGETPATKLLLEDLGGGRARLRLDQEIPWPTVLRIVELIRGQVQ
jgi:transcriptional regulator with XRE-family HTH domain